MAVLGGACINVLNSCPHGMMLVSFLGTGGDLFFPIPTKKHRSKVTHAG